MNIFSETHPNASYSHVKYSTPQSQQFLSYIPTEINLQICQFQNQQPMLRKEQSYTQDHQLNKLKNLLDINIHQVNSMIKQVVNNQNLVKYFEIAGASRLEVLEGLHSVRGCVEKFIASLRQHDINLVILQSTFQFFYEYFGTQQLSTLSNFQKAIKILDLQSKMSSCIQLLAGSLTLPYDITTLPKQKFQNVWKKVKFQKCGKVQQVAQKLVYLKRILGITTSAVLDQNQKKGAFTKVMAFCLSYPQYYFSDKIGTLKSMRFYRKPTIDIAQNIWNLPQNGLTAKITKLFSMESISVNLKIYIPLDQNDVPEDILQYNIQAIQVRVLYNDSLIYRNTNNLVCCGNLKNQKIRKIILHIHGGGFVALSSRSMQTYTRRWAKELEVPVFSIDYRMPPFYRFPTAPYDCLIVYSFIIRHISKYFNIIPEEIVIAGDSAGGNLSCALAGLILKYKLPIPKGLFVAYPACDLRKIFSPSRVYSFNDPLLNPPMLMLCLTQYLNNKSQHQNNPLASPILFTEQYVNEKYGNKQFPLDWPRTIIQVGGKDPLLDDSLRLLQRLTSSNIQCECQIYENLSHGFLSLDFAIPGCSKTIDDSISHLRKLLN